MALTKLPRNAIADGGVTSNTIEDGAIIASKISADTTIAVSKTSIGVLPPTISSLNTSVINPTTGATVTITGSRFVSIPDVKFLNTTTGARITASSVGFTSSTTLTATFPSGQTGGIYKVIIENPDGLGVISISTITYSIAPAWSTASGSLGSFDESVSVNVSLLAYDDDSTAVSSYSLQSGSLPSGITLSGDSSIGSLVGTTPEVDADTAYNFTIRATDNESQTSDRAFSMTINNWLIANSLRFNSGSSDYLSRTPASATNRKTFTFSTWIKRSTTTSSDIIFGVGTNPEFLIGFESTNSDQLTILTNAGSIILTNRLFRDVSAWYHIVVSVDTTQATASDRCKLYINGVQETSFASTSYPTQNTDLEVNNNVTHQIGRFPRITSRYLNGYMADTYLIDGQALTPTAFGETDTASGIWIPKKYSGSYGTNGFKFEFRNSGVLGTDTSGNGNNFTVNNLTAIDQTTDTPQNTFATLNPLSQGVAATSRVFSNGNTSVLFNGGDDSSLSTIGVSTGKWYSEFKATAVPTTATVGVGNEGSALVTNPGACNIGSSAGAYGYFSNGQKRINGGSLASYGDTWTTNDIIGVALDLSNGVIWFSKNGVWQASATIGEIEAGTTTNACATGLSGTFFFGGSNSASATTGVAFSANFGNPSFTISSGNTDGNGYGNFEYAVPSGYLSLCTANLSEVLG